MITTIMTSKFEHNPPATDPHIPDVRPCGCGACQEIDALRAENERIEAEFRAEIQTEHAAYQELHRKNEDLKRRLAAQDDVVLAARATVAAAHRRGNDIETGLVSGLYDALRRAGMEPLY